MHADIVESNKLKPGALIQFIGQKVLFKEPNFKINDMVDLREFINLDKGNRSIVCKSEKNDIVMFINSYRLTNKIKTPSSKALSWSNLHVRKYLYKESILFDWAIDKLPKIKSVLSDKGKSQVVYICYR